MSGLDDPEFRKKMRKSVTDYFSDSDSQQTSEKDTSDDYNNGIDTNTRKKLDEIARKRRSDALGGR